MSADRNEEELSADMLRMAINNPAGWTPRARSALGVGGWESIGQWSARAAHLAVVAPLLARIRSLETENRDLKSRVALGSVAVSEASAALRRASSELAPGGDADLVVYPENLVNPGDLAEPGPFGGPECALARGGDRPGRCRDCGQANCVGRRDDVEPGPFDGPEVDPTPEQRAEAARMSREPMSPEDMAAEARAAGEPEEDRW